MNSKYEEFDLNKGTLFSDKGGFGSRNTGFQRTFNSFYSSDLIRNTLDTSFVLNSCQDDLILPRKPAKASRPLRQADLLARPRSVLKTTFLDDTEDYNFPRRLTPDLSERPDKTQGAHKKPSLSCVTEIRPNQKPEERVLELENTLLIKDSLIGTLKTRVVKLSEELEETHRKLNSGKNIIDELKLKDLQRKSEDLEKSLQEYYVKVKELNSCLDKKDEEISILSKELKSQREELGSKINCITKLEKLLESTQGSRDYHKNYFDQEAIRPETSKINKESENNVLEKNTQNFEGLQRKLEASYEEADRFQRLLAESKEKNGVLKENNFSLMRKVQELEGQVKAGFRGVRGDYEKFCINAHDQGEFKGHGKENLCGYPGNTGFSAPSNLVNEIMELLGLSNSFDVIPSLKKIIKGNKEKKLVKKIILLVKTCLNKDKHTELSYEQVWRIIKRVFEDYAKIVKEVQVSEVKVVREMLGNGNLVDKVNLILQENLIMKEVVSIAKKKLSLPVTASFSDLEQAINSLFI